MKIAIVWAEFNKVITERMLAAAKKEAEKEGLEIAETRSVPGSFDMPIMVKKVLENRNVEGATVLGAIIQGETKHDEVMAYSISPEIIKLSLQYNKPVTFGIIGPAPNIEIAEERAEIYGERAIKALKKLLLEMKRT